MNTLLWILQCLLAALMLLAGLLKLVRSKQQLLDSGSMNWTEDFSEQQIKGIGTLELLAAVGLILPAAIDVVPVLCAVAAIGVVLLMLGAGATHGRRGELANLLPNMLIGAVALFIAIERFGPHAF